MPHVPPGATSWTRPLAAVALLAAFHGGLAMLPRPPFTAAMNLVLFAVNLYVLHCAAHTLRGRSAAAVAGFVAGYAALLGLVVGVLDKKPLFVLLAVAYASVFGSPPLLGLLGLFVLCFVVLQPYAFETFLPLAFVWTLLWRARHRAPPFVLACLGVGLLAMAVVLFPLLHLGLSDSAQTLWRTATRPDVRQAIWLSLVSSTVATAVVMAFGVPLAYALARLEFPGKRAVETLIDVPILVPQSVAGIALIALVGPGSPLGQALAAAGVRVSGALLGVVIAQVFVATPFLVKTAMTAFEGVPVALEQASRSLGRSAGGTFLRISLPLAGRGVAAGAALAWARAVSEFGTVALFASSPVTAPVLVHTEFLRAGASESRPIAVALLVTCLWFFLLLRLGGSVLPFQAARRGARP